MLLNKERAIGPMKEYGIDAMLATSPDNVQYLSDYSAWTMRVYRSRGIGQGMQSFAVLPRDTGSAPALITQGLTYLAQHPTWIEDIYTWGPARGGDLPPEAQSFPEAVKLHELSSKVAARRSNSAREALVKALKDNGLDKGTLAVDMEGMSPDLLEYLRTECPQARIKDGVEFFRLVRAVKTPEEIQRIRIAADITELAMQAVKKKTAPGVTENELAIEFRSTLTREGALPDFFNVPSGKRAGTLWEPSDYRLQKGDLVWMDGGCIYQGYHSDTGTCGVVGEEPSEDLRARFKWLEAGIEASLAKVHTGAKCSEVIAAMHDAMVKAGAERPFGFGHGIGIQPRDLPMLQPPFTDFRDDILIGSSDLTLETDMVINLETPIWWYGIGGLQIEYTLAVKPNGYEMLTPGKHGLWTL